MHGMDKFALCALAVGVICLGEGGVSAAQDNGEPKITENTVKQALQLLKDSLACQADPVISGPHKVLWGQTSIGNEFQLGVEVESKDYYTEPGIDATRLESWEIIGEVTDKKAVYGANWNLLSDAEVQGKSVLIRCSALKECIGFHQFMEPGCGVNALGEEVCGNAGGNYLENATTRESKVTARLEGVCPNQINNVALAINISVRILSGAP